MININNLILDEKHRNIKRKVFEVLFKNLDKEIQISGVIDQIYKFKTLTIGRIRNNIVSIQFIINKNNLYFSQNIFVNNYYYIKGTIKKNNKKFKDLSLDDIYRNETKNSLNIEKVFLTNFFEINLIEINKITQDNIQIENKISNFDGKLDLNLSNIHKHKKFLSNIKDRHTSYRFLNNINNYRKLNNLICCIRDFLISNNFDEIYTPILSFSTLEGAKQFETISKNKNNYVLSQSPQIYKQLITSTAGITRYFQICSCFRDEDGRFDRQPEFRQLDLEMAFKSFADIKNFIYKFFRKIIFDLNLKSKNYIFVDMEYKLSKKIYLTDKPDLRFLFLFNNNILSIFFNKKIFLSNPAEYFSKAEIINNMHGLKNFLINIFKNNNNIDYNNNINFIIDKLTLTNNDNLNIELLFGNKIEILENNFEFFKINLEIKLYKKLDISVGKRIIELKKNISNILIKFCDKLNKLNDILLLRDKKQIIRSYGYFIFLYNFPYFELKNNEIVCSHHPFTNLNKKYYKKLENFLKINPKNRIENFNIIEDILSESYDIVFLGSEILSGSSRIYDLNLQKKIFNILGYEDSVIELKMKNFFYFFKKDFVNTSGFALGIERFSSKLFNNSNISNQFFFPKSSDFKCFLEK